MKSTSQHSKALNSLYDHARFSKEELRAMPVEMIKQLLAADGVVINKAEEKLKRAKEKWINSKLYQEACKQTTTTGDKDVDLSGLSDDEIKAALLKRYKRLEEIPLAARGFKELGRTELESMYRDLILKRK